MPGTEKVVETLARPPCTFCAKMLEYPLVTALDVVLEAVCLLMMLCVERHHLHKTSENAIGPQVGSSKLEQVASKQASVSITGQLGRKIWSMN